MRDKDRHLISIVTPSRQGQEIGGITRKRRERAGGSPGGVRFLWGLAARYLRRIENTARMTHAETQRAGSANFECGSRSAITLTHRKHRPDDSRGDAPHSSKIPAPNPLLRPPSSLSAESFFFSELWGVAGRSFWGAG